MLATESEWTWKALARLELTKADLEKADATDQTLIKGALMARMRIENAIAEITKKAAGQVKARSFLHQICSVSEDDLRKKLTGFGHYQRSVLLLRWVRTTVDGLSEVIVPLKEEALRRSASKRRGGLQLPEELQHRAARALNDYLTARGGLPVCELGDIPSVMAGVPRTQARTLLGKAFPQLGDHLMRDEVRTRSRMGKTPPQGTEHMRSRRGKATALEPKPDDTLAEHLPETPEPGSGHAQGKTKQDR